MATIYSASSSFDLGRRLFHDRLVLLEPSMRGRELARILHELVKSQPDPEESHQLADAALVAFACLGGDGHGEIAELYQLITRWYS